MKILMIIFSVFILSTSCKNEKESILNDKVLFFPEYTVLNDTVFKILNSYLNYTQNAQQFIVCQLYIDQEPDSVTYYLRYSQYYDYLFIHPPSGYIKIKDRVIILYDGINQLMKEDSLFTKSLHHELKNYHLKALDEMLSLIEYNYWTIVFYRGEDKYHLYKRRFSPYGNLIIN